MPLFSTAVPNDPKWFEAFVLSVDATRAVCKIQTSYGQRMDNVPWLSNSYDGPEFNDRVLVTTVTGSPIIIGIMSRIGDVDSTATQIDSGTLEADTGNYSTLSHDVVGDPEKPGDILAGDKIFSNSSGGLFGLLRGGSFIAKASRLAQIFITKYDDLVRIIARNYELFTDFCTDVYANVRGRAYRFAGYSATVSSGRADIYQYQEYYGDTVLGPILKGDYYGLTPSTFAAEPAADNIIRKFLVVDGSNNKLFRQDLNYSTGEIYTIVSNAAGTSYTYVDHAQAIFDVKLVGGSGAQLTIAPTSIVVTFGGTSTVTLDATKAQMVFGSHFCTIDSSGVHLG